MVELCNSIPFMKQLDDHCVVEVIKRACYIVPHQNIHVHSVSVKLKGSQWSSSKETVPERGLPGLSSRGPVDGGLQGWGQQVEAWCKGLTGIFLWGCNSKLRRKKPLYNNKIQLSLFPWNKGFILFIQTQFSTFLGCHLSNV